MKVIPFFLRYLYYFKLDPLLLQTFIIINHSSQNMSSTSGFTEFVQPSTPPKSPTPAPSIISPPENTPAETTTPPQLAIRSQPLLDNEDALSAVFSTIDFNRVAETANDGDDAPVGFIVNDPESRHYHPVYIPNPQFRKWDGEEPMVVAKYIRYSPEYLFVTGCNGKAYLERTIPVYIGRKANHHRCMNPTMWKEFRRNSPQEFIINEAVADLGDPRVVAELNRYQGKAELQETLGDILKEARQWVSEVEKEYLVVQRELVDSMNRIERAGLYDTLQMQMRRMFSSPISPDRHYSPEVMPIAPRRGGPVEMPVLMDEGHRKVQCFNCKRHGHVRKDCTKPKRRGCRTCGDQGHCKGTCPYRKRGKVEVSVKKEVTQEIAEASGQLSLLERIVLLDRPEWTPPQCPKCSKRDPGHSELGCPEYEYCGWCWTSGSYGFIARHKCTAGYEDEVMSNGWGAADEYADQNRWD